MLTRPRLATVTGAIQDHVHVWLSGEGFSCNLVWDTVIDLKIVSGTANLALLPSCGDDSISLFLWKLQAP